MATATDRALVIRSPGAVDLESRPIPVPATGETLVRPTAVGLCGTDLELIDGTLDPAYVRYPLVLGHEWTGTVAGAGDGAFAPGTRVVVEGIIPCWRCPECTAGRTNLCQTYDEIGFTRDGAGADHVRVPSAQLHRLAPAVGVDDAALTEPSAVVLRALHRLGLEPGARVLVVGDGTVALLAVHCLGLWSPAEVVLLGRRPEQRPLALRAGASRFETRPPGAGRFDVVVEAAGTTQAVETALAAVRRGGCVGLLGLPPHGATAALAVDDVVNGDLTLRASFGYTANAWRQAVALLNAGRIRPGLLVTHRRPLADWRDALSVLRRGDGPRGKVLLTVDETARA